MRYYSAGKYTHKHSVRYVDQSVVLGVVVVTPISTERDTGLSLDRFVFECCLCKELVRRPRRWWSFPSSRFRVEQDNPQADFLSSTVKKPTDQCGRMTDGRKLRYNPETRRQALQKLGWVRRVRSTTINLDSHGQFGSDFVQGQSRQLYQIR